MILAPLVVPAFFAHSAEGSRSENNSDTKDEEIARFKLGRNQPPSAKKDEQNGQGQEYVISVYHWVLPRSET